MKRSSLLFSRGLCLALSLGIGLTAALVTVPTAEARRIRASVSREIRQADAQLQAGRYQYAEKRLMHMLKRNPSSKVVRANLSVAQAGLYKLGAAEKNAEQVLAKDPNNSDAHVALGMVYRARTASQDMTYRTRRPQLLSQSAAELERASELMPNDPLAHLQRGITYRHQGRYDDAQAAFQKALSVSPRYAEAILNAGITSMASGDNANAKVKFKEAIRRNSKNPMAHYHMGNANLATGDAHGALKNFNTALSLDRGNAMIMGKMGEAYESQGNIAAAVAQYQKAMHSNPSYMPAYTGLAGVYDRRGDGELAMSQLKSALNVKPTYTPALNQLGRLALTVDKPDQAVQYYNDALKVDPNNTDSLHGLSQALTQVAYRQASQAQTMGFESQLVDAEQMVNEALRLQPNDMSLHLASLRIAQMTGKPSRSEAELMRIVSMHPENDAERLIQSDAFMVLGRYSESDAMSNSLISSNRGNLNQLLLLGDNFKASANLPLARAAYKAAAQASPGNIKAERGLQRLERLESENQKTYRLADALNAKGILSPLVGGKRQRKSALDFYEEVASTDPRKAEARLALGKLYQKIDNYPKAITSYEHYLGLSPELEPKERQKYERKIAKLKDKYAKKMASR